MVKHISHFGSGGSYRSMKIINPEELSEKGKQECFVPRWTVGAVDALHEGA